MEYITKKVCYLAESLLIKGEFLSWRRFSIPPQSIADIEIDPICNRQSDRIVVDKIITSGIVESYPDENNSTIYIVEVLAAIASVLSVEENESMMFNGGSQNTCEHVITFTICHNSDESFTLFDVVF